MAAKRSQLPRFIEPQLTLQVKAPLPSGALWCHEIKFDGYRIRARINGDDIRLPTRSGSIGPRDTERRPSP